VPNPALRASKSADATASRPLQFAPSGYSISRGSGRAASLARHVGRAQHTGKTLAGFVAGPPNTCLLLLVRITDSIFCLAVVGGAVAVHVGARRSRQSASSGRLSAFVIAIRPHTSERRAGGHSCQTACHRRRYPAGCLAVCTWRLADIRDRESGLSRSGAVESLGSGRRQAVWREPAAVPDGEIGLPSREIHERREVSRTHRGACESDRQRDANFMLDWPAEIQRSSAPSSTSLPTAQCRGAGATGAQREESQRCATRGAIAVT